MTEALLTLISVAALLLGSPGPAPLALAAVGAAYGVSRGLPFLAGILVGLSVAILATIAGLATVLSLYPTARVALQILGSVYILYVAYKVASAPVVKNHSVQEQPPSFRDGLILNLLNPKAYAAFLAIFSQFTLPMENSLIALLATGVVCMAVAALVDAVWLILGGIIRPIFKQPLQARIIRISFAVLMVIAVGWTLYNLYN